MKKSSALIFSVLATTALSGSLAFAAGDELLDTLEGSNTPAQTNDGANHPAAGNMFRPHRAVVDLAKLTDPFQKHLYAQFETAEQVPFDVQEWANGILLGDYVKASHLWSVVQPQAPAKLQNAMAAAQLYTLWKMGLNQTFFTQWIKNLGSSQFANSSSEMNLELVINSHFDQWLIDNAIVLSPAQEMTILNLSDKNPMTSTLKAWALLRKGDKGETVLNQLPDKSKLRFYLAETVALDHARKNDLVGVARILKRHIEPTIETFHDPAMLTQYYMTIGRLLYQSHKLAAAKEYYEKVPNSSPEFLQAREELAWVLLRQGDIAQLRGEIRALSSPLFNDSFAPDVYVVRSISNLKMCYYDAVEKDFDKFGRNNKVWAQKIDQAIAATATPVPPTLDFYSTFATQAVQKLALEKARLEQLGRDSIGAALPAVGMQKHWKEAQDDLTISSEIAKKTQEQEYRRQWKNEKMILAEAIRKMRFVKVEFLTQIRQFSEGQLDKSNLVADAGTVIPGASFKTDAKQIVFPIDGEPWPDELFKLRSAAQAKCLKGAK